MNEENKKLIKEYPFLKIHNVWTNEDLSESYDYTWLDELEPGWRIAFGKELCNDLLTSLTEDGCLDDFKFLEIKEKFAALRLYASGYGEKTKNVLAKYEELSRYYCGHCGKLARYITTGWYYPLCDDCVKEVHGDYIPIEKHYGYDSYDEIKKEVKLIIEDFQYDRYWKSF